MDQDQLRHASFRHAGPGQLAIALQDARDYTLALFDRLADAGYADAARLPRLAIVNPPLWELGHTAWFAEWFVLRAASSSRPGDANGHSLLARGDDWFDSNLVPHRSRWALDLPAPGAVRSYCSEVLERILERLAGEPGEDAALYPYRLALAHEDMHGEALLYTMQTLGVPLGDGMAGKLAAPPPLGEIGFDGGSFLRGGEQSRGFVFDNEKAAASCRVAPFVIDAAPVSNARFQAFVDDGGYRDPDHWSEAGRAWLKASARTAPRYWRRAEDGNAGSHEGSNASGPWQQLLFGRRLPLVPEAPVRHLNLHEAQAWCRWAGRRLPTEDEWEFAATSGHAAFRWGQVWEWTASPFLPFAGFAPDRYLEYSAPWFGSRQVLRGASFATPARLRSPRFRNFYTAERDDIFAGLRSCAP